MALSNDKLRDAKLLVKLGTSSYRLEAYANAILNRSSKALKKPKKEP